jgi:PAS domain S-box-containing protein
VSAGADERTGSTGRGFSTSQLLRMLDHLPAMVAWWDADLRNVFANTGFAAWFRMTPEAALGRHMRDVLGPEDFADSERYATCALKGERSTFARVLHDPSGEARSTTHHYIPATVEGRPVGFFMLIVDISARSRVERALEESVRQMALLEERQRIAADLHDMVIQRLFAAGLELAAVRRGSGNVEARLNSAAVGVDEGIRELRRAIHSLREVSTPKQVPAMIERILGNVSRVLGFVPTMTYSGTLDRVPELVLQDLLAVVNEALSNVARHAGASAVSVELAGTAEEVLLRVADDGRGVGSTTRSSGLSNMRDRAERHGGSFRLSDNQPRGTVLEWRVPLGARGAAAPVRRPSTEEDGDRAFATPEEPARLRGGREDIDPRALFHMIDNLPAIVGAYDERARVLFANRAHEEYYGVSPEAILGRHVSEALGSDLYERSRHQLNEVLTGRTQHFERTLRDAAGNERFMHVSYVPDIADGEVQGFYCLATDISARVRAEEALDESTRQMTLLEERQRITMSWRFAAIL